MFVGHYAVAVVAKRAAPRTSLGALIAAAILVGGAITIALASWTDRHRVLRGTLSGRA